MSKILLTIFVTILCFHTNFAQTKAPNAGTASISGTITSNGQPIRGARIMLRTQSDNQRNSSQPPSTKSDQYGNYRITGLKAGQYGISISAPPLIYENNNRMGGNNINISDGENIENMNFELVRGGVVTGTITGPDGRPLVETNVDISKFDEKGRVENVWSIDWQMRRTDDRGVYRIYGLPKGRYLASAGIKGAPGSIHMTSEPKYIPKTFYGDTDDPAKAKVIEVDEDTESTDIDIKIKEVKKFQKVFGRITNLETGAPVTGALLSIGSIAKPDSNGRERVTASGCCSEVSDGNGEFKFKSILPGRYAVFYSQQNNDTVSKDYYSEATIIEVKDSDIYGVEVKMLRGITINGNVIIEGPQSDLSQLSRYRLRATNAIDNNNASLFSSHSNSTTKINSDGSFVFKGIYPGKVNIFFDWGSQNDEFKIDHLEYNGKTIMPHYGDGMDLSPGSNISGVRVILQKNGSLQLHGEIKILNGNLPVDTVIAPNVRKVKPEASNIGNSGVVDTRKKFIVNNLTEGEYEVTLKVFSRNSDSEEFKILKRIIEQTKQIVTVTSGPPQTIVLTVDLGGQN